MCSRRKCRNRWNVECWSRHSRHVGLGIDATWLLRPRRPPCLTKLNGNTTASITGLLLIADRHSGISCFRRLPFCGSPGACRRRWERRRVVLLETSHHVDFRENYLNFLVQEKRGYLTGVWNLCSATFELWMPMNASEWFRI